MINGGRERDPNSTRTIPTLRFIRNQICLTAPFHNTQTKTNPGFYQFILYTRRMLGPEKHVEPLQKHGE